MSTIFSGKHGNDAVEDALGGLKIPVINGNPGSVPHI